MGTTSVTLVSADAGDIPGGTIVCLDLDCRNLDDVVAASVPDGTTVTFTDIVPGDHLISVTVNGTLVASTTVTVAPDAVTAVMIVIPTAEGTPSSIIVDQPASGSGQPVDLDGGDAGDSGSDDGGDAGDSGLDDGGHAASSGANGSGGGSAAAPVTSLPSTGTGDETPASAMIVLIGGMVLIAIAAGLAMRNRRAA